jgi:ATP-dependent DNA helicase 2 subunit 1
MTSSSSTAAAALSSSISGAPTLSTHSGGGGGGGSEWGFLGGDDEDGGGDWIAQQFSGGGGEELGGRDALIFLIDARESMLVPLSDGKVPLAATIECAAATLSQKIIQSEGDLVGVAFFGTKAKRNANDFDHVYVYAPLDRPGAQLIIELESMARAVQSERRFDLGSGPAGACALADVLWTCSTMFSACTLSMAEKRVFLFTDDDSPTAGDLALREQALQRTKDLTELKVGFYLYPMTRADRAFDSTLFYDELMRINHHDELEFDSYIIAPGELLDELRTEVRKRAFKRRALAHFTLRLGRAGGRDVELGVDLFSLVQEAKKSYAATLDSRNLQPVKTDSRWVCEDTGTLLLSTQMQHSIDYGGERVVFSAAELQQIKRTAAEPGLELFGFKPRSALKFHHNIKHSAFLFPNEAVVRGGTKAFAALVEQMAALDRVAIGALAPRANAAARLVALLPQREESDEHGNPLLPCGLCVIPLPFADDIRRLELPPMPTPSSELRSAMKAVVKTVELNDISLADPALQKTYVNLQAIALERDDVITVVDAVVPDAALSAASNKHLAKFAALAFPSGYVAVMPKTPTGSKKSGGTKRAAAGDGTSKAAASRRALTDFSKSELAEYVGKPAFGRYTVPELKAYLVDRGVDVPAKANKATLSELVIKHVGGKAAPPAKHEPVAKKLRLTLEDNGERHDHDDDDNDNDDDNDGDGGDDADAAAAAVVATEDDGFNLPEEMPPASASSDVLLPPCKYGAACYRKNELHLKSFSHPPKAEPRH